MTQDKFDEYRLYGRRQGSPLSPRQQQLVEKLLPLVQISKCEDREKKLHPGEIFSDKFSRFHLEIGFGGAEHLVWQAQRAPDIGFIGCEPFINGVVKLLTSIEELKLDNIRVCDHDARDFLSHLPVSCIEKTYILFPDPWPKQRHRKRRFINQTTLNQLSRVMMPGAHLCFASDIPDYVTWVKAHIASSDCFEIIDVEPVEKPQTRYEQKAVREGRSSVYLTIACIK